MLIRLLGISQLRLKTNKPNDSINPVFISLSLDRRAITITFFCPRNRETGFACPVLSLHGL